VIQAGALGESVDAYCERTSPEFWAEPVNAVSNAAFLIAALIALVVARRARRLDVATGLLIGLAVAVGIGSFLFHTIATRWAALADVGPILAFIVAYLAFAMRRFFALAWPAALAIAAGYLPLAWSTNAALRALALRPIGGAAGYVGAVIALATCAGLLAWRGHPAWRGLALAAVVFVVSLTLRTLDTPLCAGWPLGTHFLWHLLNGVVVAILLLTMIAHGRRSRRRG
jgi:hypothetical protein